MKRECGDCNVCCIIGEVPELSKPAHTPCIFLKDCKKGCCSVFDNPDLPDTCRNYNCAWKEGFGAEYDKPNKNNVMFTINKLENQIYITAIELKENAIKETYANHMVMDLATKTNIPIIVVKHGVKPPRDRGDWVIITKQTLPRCKRIAGEVIYEYDDDVIMYELSKGK